MADEEPFFPFKMPTEELTLLAGMGDLDTDARRSACNELKRREDERNSREERTLAIAAEANRIALKASLWAMWAAIIAIVALITATKDMIAGLIL